MHARCAQAALFAALLTSTASAQVPGAIALDQLEPAPPGDRLFGVPSPSAGGHLVPRALVLFTHTDAPLTVSRGGTDTPVVRSQSLLQVSASLALWDRLLVSALLPVALVQRGDGTAAFAGETRAALTAPALGDLRLGARLRLFGEDSDLFQIGVGAYLRLPTGATGAFVGEGAVGDSPQLLLGGRVQRFVWSAASGPIFRSSDNPSTFWYGGGAAVLLWDERVQLGAEVYAQTPIQGGAIQLTDRIRVARALRTNAELLFGARLRVFEGVLLGAAAGPGLGDALGTPALRGVASIGWSPPTTPAARAVQPTDTDEDGLIDAEDACPYAHGPKEGAAARRGCPSADRDGDDVVDPDDACPDVPGGPPRDAERRGCPPE